MAARVLPVIYVSWEDARAVKDNQPTLHADIKGY
jgi:hypothetical protein